MALQCEIRELPGRPALSIRTRVAVGDLPEMFAKGYGQIAQHLGQLNEAPAGPPFAVYYNMDMNDLDVEFGFPVSKRLDGSGEIQPGEAPKGKVATALHVGPYAELEPSYRTLMQWIADQGHEMTGIACEMYLNDPREVPPEQTQTQIAMFLKD